MKKHKMKKSVAALGIFGLIAAVLWAFFYVALGAGLSETHLIGKHTLLVGKMFTFDFAGRTGPTIFTIVLGLAVIATLIISIVIAKKKKRFVTLLAWLYLLLAAYVSIELFANMTGSPVGPENYNACGYLAVLASTNGKIVLSGFGVVATAVLVLILGLCFWIVSMLDARGKLEKKVDEEELAREKQEREDEIRRIVEEELAKRPQVIQYFYGVRPEQLVDNNDVKQEVKDETVNEEPKPEPNLDPKPEP